MPAYTPLFESAGANLGEGLGGLLGGALGQVGNVLSAPRRMIWNAIGLPDSGSEVLQKYAGMDPDSYLTKGLGMGLEMLGDPLTYLGGLPGKLLGGLGGKALGEGLEAAAAVRGPQFAGGMEKLLQAGIPEAADATSEGGGLLQLLKDSPGKSWLKEVPPGIQFVDHGTEGLVFRTPQGGALRLGPITDPEQSLARANIDQVLQPTRAAVMDNVRVEHLPWADTAPFRNMSLNQSYESGLVPQMQQAIEAQGYRPVDVRPANLGVVNGQTKVIDPGGVLPGARGLDELPDYTGQQPGWLTNKALDWLGSDQAIQQELYPATQAAASGPESRLAGYVQQARTPTPNPLTSQLQSPMDRINALMAMRRNPAMAAQ